MPIDIGVLVALLGFAVLYLRGLLRLAPEQRPTPAGRIRVGLGAAALLVALSSPMEVAASQSLALHMVQHQLLALVAAPLLASGRVLRVTIAALSSELPAPRGLPSPGVVAASAAILHLATMTVWHLPSLYDLALRQPEIHHLEHLTMLGTAFLAWTAILSAAETDRGAIGAIAGLAPLAIGGAAVGVLLLAAPTPLYPTYLASSGDPLTDQRVAGALMKVGALLVYVGAAAAIGARWFRRLELRDAAGSQPHRMG